MAGNDSQASAVGRGDELDGEKKECAKENHRIRKERTPAPSILGDVLVNCQSTVFPSNDFFIKDWRTGEDALIDQHQQIEDKVDLFFYL